MVDERRRNGWRERRGEGEKITENILTLR